MKASKVLFIVAAIIVGVWVLGLLLRLGAWILSSLLYIAALIVIIGIVQYWWKNRKGSASARHKNAIDAEEIDTKK